MGIWWYGRTYWRLLAVGVAMWLLSLGPILYLNDTSTGIALPYALIQDLPLVSSGRKPSLFAVICIVIATLFAGMGLHRLVQHRSSRQRRLLLCGMALLAGIELWPPVQRPLFIFEQPAFFEEIRMRPGAVADLPIEFWNEPGQSLSLYHQIIHKQPMLGGYVARWPTYESLYVPLINHIVRMHNIPDIIPQNQEALVTMQCYYPIRHIVVRKNFINASDRLDQLRSFLNTLNGAPLRPTFEDATYIWYELPLFADQCQPFVYLGAGWHSREYTATEQWRWASAAGDIWLVNPFETPISVTLRLNAEAPGEIDATRTVELRHDEQRIAAWQVERARRDYAVVVQLPPGSNRLQVRAPTTFDPQTERDVSIAVMELQIQDYYIDNE
jgi:hypothetical protein